MLAEHLDNSNAAFAALPEYLQAVITESELVRLAGEAEAAMRSHPTGSRGSRTVEQILDVTEELFAGGDLAAISTNRIADELGVNVATIYRYFENLEAIVAMVCLRYEINLHLMLAILFEPIARVDDWRTECSSIIDAIAKHRIARPERPPLAAVLQIKQTYKPIADAATQTSGEVLGTILHIRRPEIPLERWVEIASVSSVMLRSGLSVACMATPPDMEHIELLKGMSERYFEPFVEGPVQVALSAVADRAVA